MESVIKAIAFIILAVTLILSVAGFFSDLHLVLDLASHFRFHYLIAACFTSTVFFLYRATTCAFLSVLLLVLNLSFIFPWYLDSAKPISATSQARFKLLMSNVLVSNQAPGKILSLIEKEHPEIVVVLEISERWVNALDALESDYPYSYLVPRDAAFGVGVYSKFPITSESIRYFGEQGIPSLVLTLEVNAKPITLIATHPVPPTSGGYYKSRNTHLANVFDEVTRTQGPVVLAGDLNTTMWSKPYQTLEESGLRNVRQGYGIRSTWPAWLRMVGIPIDHVLVSDHFAVLDFSVGPDVGSDHLPVIVELGLADRRLAVPADR